MQDEINKLTEENIHLKFENKQYLNELTRFMDLTEQIKDKELKEQIITQMLRCDMELTKFAEEKILK